MKSFGMFTVVGDVVVASLVEQAIENYRGYDWLEDQLMKLSKVSCFAEATDTAVREACYIALEEVDLV
jgi:predicted RecB family nuclease